MKPSSSFKGNEKDNPGKRGPEGASAPASTEETGRGAREADARPCTILVIGKEDRFSPELMDYAIQMARRLGCRILAVSATDAHMSLPRTHRHAACQAFEESATEGLKQFKEQARMHNVELHQRVCFGNQDDIISQLYLEENGRISYVVTEPDPELVDSTDGRVSIPVFGLTHVTP